MQQIQGVSGVGGSNDGSYRNPVLHRPKFPSQWQHLRTTKKSLTTGSQHTHPMRDLFKNTAVEPRDGPWLSTCLVVLGLSWVLSTGPLSRVQCRQFCYLGYSAKVYGFVQVWMSTLTQPNMQPLVNPTIKKGWKELTTYQTSRLWQRVLCNSLYLQAQRTH